jgi:hypothetical protein
MSLFNCVLLKTIPNKLAAHEVQHTLQMLRYKVFSKAAYITTESRKAILNVALAVLRREWTQGLWDGFAAGVILDHVAEVNVDHLWEDVGFEAADVHAGANSGNTSFSAPRAQHT